MEKEKFFLYVQGAKLKDGYKVVIQDSLFDTESVTVTILNERNGMAIGTNLDSRWIHLAGKTRIDKLLYDLSEQI